MMHSGVQDVTLKAHPQPELSQVGDFLSVTLQVSDKLCWSPRVGTGRASDLGLPLKDFGDSSLVRGDPREIGKPGTIDNRLS